MNKSIYFFLLCCFLLLHFQLEAQTGVQLSNSPKISLGQWQQPAFLATDDFKHLSIGLGGAYDLASSSLSLGNWPLNDDFLDEGEKADILDDLGDDNRFNILAQGDLLVNFRIKKKPYSMGFRQRSLAYAGFGGKDIMGLILLGNAAYTGQRISSEDVLLSIQSYSELSFGTASKQGNWSYGGRIKLLLGNNYQSLDLREFSLFTEELGTAIEVQANFDLDRKAGEGAAGFGAGVDLGASYQINEKLMAQASLIDFGFISWSVEKNQNIVNTTYEGLLIEDIGNLDFSGENSIFSSDSLERLFFPDTVEVNSSNYLPGFAQIGLNYQLSNRSSLGVLFRYGFFQNSPMSNRLQFHTIFQHNINKWLKGGIHASFGGFEGIDAGLMLAGNIGLNKEQDLQLFLQSDKLLGLLLPDSGRGQGLQAGIIFRY
ncbi:MAG: DUF5723 family protein [Bacteroidia bacterium]|nr:DUF5723 family protein [Bacteroidia bacterium]